MKYSETKKFIEVWAESESVSEVMEKLGIKNRSTVYSRAKYLRDKGIILKKFDARSSEISENQWKELKELSKKLQDTKGLEGPK